jgi:hypothetical protein
MTHTRAGKELASTVPAHRNRPLPRASRRRERRSIPGGRAKICHLLLVLTLGTTSACAAKSPLQPGSPPLPSAAEAAGSVLWATGMETGDLADWAAYPGEETAFDSGLCARPEGGVTDAVAHRGRFALSMSAHTPEWGESGCRQFRFPEPLSPAPRHYSFWPYLPHHYEIGYWAMVAQFKSRTGDGRNDALWSLQLKNRADGRMMLILTYKCQCEGPFEGEAAWDDKGFNLRDFKQDQAVIEPRRWTLIEIDRTPSTGYEGAISVRQDGALLFDLDEVRTTYEGGADSFSLSAYGQAVRALDQGPGGGLEEADAPGSWFTTIFDDVRIEGWAD